MAYGNPMDAYDDVFGRIGAAETPPTAPSSSQTGNPSSPTSSGGRLASFTGRAIGNLGLTPAVEEARALSRGAKSFLGSIPQEALKTAGSRLAIGAPIAFGISDANSNPNAPWQQHLGRGLQSAAQIGGGLIGGAIGGAVSGPLAPVGMIAGQAAGAHYLPKLFGLGDDPYAAKMQTEYVAPAGSTGPSDASQQAYLDWEAKRKAALPQQPQQPPQQPPQPAIGDLPVQPQNMNVQSQAIREEQYPVRDISKGYGGSMLTTMPGVQLSDAQRAELSRANVADYERQAAASRLSRMATLAAEGKLNAGDREAYRIMQGGYDNMSSLASQADTAKAQAASRASEAELARQSAFGVAKMQSDTSKYVAGIQSSDRMAEIERKMNSSQERLNDVKAKQELGKIAMQDQINGMPDGPAKKSLLDRYHKIYGKPQVERPVSLGQTTDSSGVQDTLIYDPQLGYIRASQIGVPQAPEDKFGFKLPPRK